jgi:predicted transcriptional regulator
MPHSKAEATRFERITEFYAFYEPPAVVVLPFVPTPRAMASICARFTPWAAKSFRGMRPSVHRCGGPPAGRYVPALPLPKAVPILYDRAMTTKEIALKTIEQLPEDASWEDIQERINFIVGVRKGLRELDEGQGIPHDQVKEEFAEWLTK